MNCNKYGGNFANLQPIESILTFSMTFASKEGKSIQYEQNTTL